MSTTETKSISLTPETLKDMISAAVATAIQEMKKPSELEQRELDKQATEAARKERQREQMRRDIESSEKERVAREKACGHIRANGSSRMAWMTYSDQVIRGVCQKCGAKINPGHEDYARLIKIPAFEGI